MLKVPIKKIHEFQEDFVFSNLMCSTDCDENSTLTYTHLISDTIPFKYGSLFQVIDHEPFKYYSEIIICLPRNTPNFSIYKTYLKTYGWDVDIRKDCEANIMPQNHTLAMITYEAPNTDLFLPAIFYHTPYMLPEVMDRFPNSLSLSTDWAPLKYAFVEFLKKMNWQRVAVVSDDAVYSEAFADELTSLFTMEGLIFTDQRCSKTCNFVKSLILLKNADAKVIILNVDKENARQLVSAITRLQLRGVLWIVRDWPFEQVSLFQGMTEVYSLTLSPGYNKTEDYHPYLSSINKGIQIIDRIYKNVLGDKETFLRNLSKAVRPKDYKTYAYVMLFRDNPAPSVVASMIIEEDRVKIMRFSDVYGGAVPSDLKEACIVRSYDYFQPCNHLKLLLLVLVWIAFALAVLLIIVCFNKYRRKRYNRLS
ncbi:uncharacterized protein LOC135081160 [Ostrinia nubilalis]|uniref:uncharacterized protein LOC135081160 n=1 Tax=Ostrinia nubilalis TaxID=29057 RepID=UPI00308224DB